MLILLFESGGFWRRENRLVALFQKHAQSFHYARCPWHFVIGIFRRATVLLPFFVLYLFKNLNVKSRATLDAHSSYPIT